MPCSWENFLPTQLGELSPNSVGRTFSQLLVTLSKFSQLRGSILTCTLSRTLQLEKALALPSALQLERVTENTASQLTPYLLSVVYFLTARESKEKVSQREGVGILSPSLLPTYSLQKTLPVLENAFSERGSRGRESMRERVQREYARESIQTGVQERVLLQVKGLFYRSPLICIGLLWFLYACIHSTPWCCVPRERDGRESKYVSFSKQVSPCITVGLFSFIYVSINSAPLHAQREV